MKKAKCFAPALLFYLLFTACGSHTEITTAPAETPSEETPEALPSPAWSEDSTKNILYLTFDDGPMQGTSTVLSILEAHKIPATFFLIGLHAAHMPRAKENLNRLRNNPLFELCNHSYTHAYRNRFEKFYMDTAGVVADFIRAQDSLRFSNNIVRTPGNNMWRTTQFVQNTMKRYSPAAEALAQNGFRLAGWDIEWMHYKQKLKQSPEKMKQELDAAFSNSVNKAKGHCVLLMHDASFHDPIDSASLVTFIRMVQADTMYRMSTVSRHPYFKNK